MTTKGKLLTACLLLLISVAAACSGRKQQPSPVSPAEREDRPIEVSSSPVLERNMKRGMEVVGSLEAQDQVIVSSQGSGTVDQIGVDVGTAVRKGAVIARLDPRELQLKLEQSEAELRQAEAKLGVKSGEKLNPEKQPDVRQARASLDRAQYDWNAAKNLVERGDISRQAYDVAQKNYDQSQARYQAALENVRNLEAVVEQKRAAAFLARKQLGDTAIVSPINGVVKEKLTSRGEYLQPGKPVASIVQINPLRLKLELPEAFSSSIARGQVVTLRVDAVADHEFQGRIKRISPSVDEKSRSLMAEAEVPNEKGLLRPGMFARAQIVSDASLQALLVPEKSIVSVAGINKVFVIDGARAVERQVKLGIRDGTLVEIIEGIRPGERVITTNTDQLHDGSSISPPA
jgi:RND family efflux transporter MFP subunit